LLGKIFGQDHGAIVFGVVGTVEQGDGAAAAGIEYRIPAVGVRFQLLPISTSKLLPALYPVVKPFPQLRAGCDILQPRVRDEVLFLHASRPEALYQDAPAIAARRGLVRALDPNHAK